VLTLVQVVDISYLWQQLFEIMIFCRSVGMIMFSVCLWHCALSLSDTSHSKSVWKSE